MIVNFCIIIPQGSAGGRVPGHAAVQRAHDGDGRAVGGHAHGHAAQGDARLARRLQPAPRLRLPRAHRQGRRRVREDRHPARHRQRIVSHLLPKLISIHQHLLIYQEHNILLSQVYRTILKYSIPSFQPAADEGEGVGAADVVLALQRQDVRARPRGPLPQDVRAPRQGRGAGPRHGAVHLLRSRDVARLHLVTTAGLVTHWSRARIFIQTLTQTLFASTRIPDFSE